MGNKLTSYTWYDKRGNVIKEHPGGSKEFIKYWVSVPRNASCVGW